MACRVSCWCTTVWTASWLAAGCNLIDPHSEDELACQHYARETCARLASCSPWLVEQTYQTTRGCRQALIGPCLRSLAQPDVLASAAGVLACGDTMPHVTCSQLANHELPPSCRAPRGRRADGAPCAVDAQCASSRCVLREAAGGSCQELASSGRSCSDSSDCQPPLVCAGNLRCSALGKRGVACTTDRPCRAPLSCLDDACTLAATGVCRGDECDPRSLELISSACAAYAATLCTQLASCAPAVVRSVYGEQATCSERARGACERSAFAADAVGTGAGIASCATALESVSCEELFQHSLPDACRLLPGRREDARACSEHAQCVGLRCARAEEESCGRCTDLSDEGGPCASESECTSGLVCTTAQRCARPQAEQGSCASDRPCAFPLLCVASVCRAPLVVGSECDPKADRCNAFAGEVCGPLSLRCEPLRYERATGPCGYVDGGWTVCERGATCVTSGGASHCVPAAAEGEVCSSSGPGCLFPARCLHSVCSLSNAAECS